MNSNNDNKISELDKKVILKIKKKPIFSLKSQLQDNNNDKKFNNNTKNS